MWSSAVRQVQPEYLKHTLNRPHIGSLVSSPMMTDGFRFPLSQK